jgi:hypothetical protein
MFRSPIYLDTDQLVPLAKYHDIEVMVDVEISQRDLGQRSGKAGISATLPISSSPGFELSGGRGSESEVTAGRTVKDNPASALNRLLDALARENGLTADLSAQPLVKRQLVELDGEWEVSPATDVGNFLAGMVNLFVQNPGALSSSTPPPEFMTLMTAGTQGGPIVLDLVPEDGQGTRVLAFLNAEHITRGATLDSLDGDRSVFGFIDAIVAEGQDYSLEKFFLAGVGRAFRRAFDSAELLENFSQSFERSLSADDLRLTGPLVVVKAVAVY